MALSRELRQELETVCGHTIEEVLARRSLEDFEQILALLTEPGTTDQQRNNAIQVLGRWGDPVAVPAIVALSTDMDERPLINALNALSELGGPDAERAIISHRRNKSADVRRFVAIGLGRLDTQRARRTLETMATSDKTEFVRTCAGEALRRR